MAQRKATKIVTKKHLARLERERRQTRAITVGSIVILAIVFLAILYGALNESLFQNFKTIVTVNGEKITVREFVSRSKATREQLIDQYMYYYQMAVMFGMDPSTNTDLAQMFTDIQNQLDYPENLANQVLTYIENDLIIKQYGQKNGIQITDEEIEVAIRNTYGYFPEGTQTLTPTSTQLAYSTLSSLQLELVTATPTSGPTSTSTPGPTFTSTPTPATASATPEPTATAITAEGFSGLYRDALDHYRSLGFNESMFRRIFFEYALYREQVKALVTADVTHDEEMVWARHILVPDLSTAGTVLTLLNAGGDFGTLAGVYSTDSGTKAVGGDLGWFGAGEMVAEFEAAVFSLDVGTISEPIQTTYGFHIIQILGHDNRPRTEEEYATAVDDAFAAWLDEQFSAATIEVNPKYLSYVPEKPTLQEAFFNLFATQTAVAPTYAAEQKTSEAVLALTPSATQPNPPTLTP